MAQEFVIKSTSLEDKVNQLLPSQGGTQAGVDLSASTMIVPVVNLTEAAEGSTLRQDLQTALSFTTANVFDFSNSTVTLVNTTGYFRVTGTVNINGGTSGTRQVTIKLNDGATDKTIFRIQSLAASNQDHVHILLDFVIFLSAGDSLIGVSNNSSAVFVGSLRQIADISGNLVNP